MMVRDRYDFVLFDTPPVLAVSDPSVVAAHVDGVLFVVHPTKRARAATRKATDTLSLVGAPIIGVIVNNVSELGSSSYESGCAYGPYANTYYSGESPSRTSTIPKSRGAKLL